MVQLSTIGPLTIHVRSTRVAAGSVRTSAAILYLVVERGREIPRRALIELFFPGVSETAGSHGLRQLVYRLRKLGVGVDGGMASVSLPRDAATWDVESCESRGQCSDKELDALSRGYLPDFAPDVSDAFAEWLDGHRSSVTTTLRRSLVTQLRDEKAKHHFAGVDRVARACLALDPFNEEATLATAESLVMSGSKSEALSVLDRYIDEVGPRSRELRLAPKLLRERISEYVVASSLLAEPTLVGRDAETATLRALLTRVGRGSAEACVVWGSSGIGKSRLLNEACSIAALQGLAVVRCALQPHDQRRPLAVLRDIAPRLLDMPGALGCAPESLALLRSLAGRGEMPMRELPRTAEDSEVALTGMLESATDLLDAVCSERPILLCIEDAHWLDPASIELIVEAVAGQRSLCILMASQQKLLLPQRLADAARLSSIEVPRLSRESATAVLQQRFEQSGRALDEEFADWATGLADGVPFYLQSLFVEYVTTGDRATIPSTLTASLASKLERLAEPTRSVFDAIVVLGKQCALARLETLVQLPRHSLLASLRELEERGLIRSTPNMVSPAHELFSVTAMRMMPASVATMLHRVVAEMLEADTEPSAAEPWDIATHWQESGDTARGLSVIRRCTEEAIRVGRPQEALAILSRVERQALTPHDNRQILEMQLAAFEAAGESPNIVACCMELVGFLRDDEGWLRGRLELKSLEARIHSGGTIAGHEGRLREILSTEFDEESLLRAVLVNLYVAEDTADHDLASETLTAIERVGHDSVARMIPYLAYHVLFGSMEEADRTAETLQAAVATDCSSKLRHRAEIHAAEALFRVGKIERAISCFQRAYHTAFEIGLRSGQIASAAELTFVYWCVGDRASFEHWHEQTSLVIERSPAASHVANHYSNGILRALDAGRPAEARELLALIRQLSPHVMEGQRSHLAMAYDLRIDLAEGTQPSSHQVDALLKAYGIGKGFLHQDLLADTLIGALRSRGRDVEAEALRSEFLGTWRRDRFPAPPRLTNLCAGSG